jgi:hypothetical protein
MRIRFASLVFSVQQLAEHWEKKKGTRMDLLPNLICRADGTVVPAFADWSPSASKASRQGFRVWNYC